MVVLESDRVSLHKEPVSLFGYQMEKFSPYLLGKDDTNAHLYLVAAVMVLVVGMMVVMMVVVVVVLTLVELVVLLLVR